MVKHFIPGLVFLFTAGTAQAAGIIDSIVSSAQAASGGWMTTALEYAKTLFFGLAAIEFVWAGTQLLLQKNELSEAVVGLLMKVVAIGFFGMVLTMAPTWIPAVMNSFKEAGQSIGGAPSLSPSSVIDQGLGVAAQMVEKGLALNGGALENAFGPGLGKWLLSAIVIGLSGIIVIIGYTIVAVQMAITLIESYIVIGGGVLMLGFMGSRWTLNIGERLFGYAVSIGAKLLTIYLIVGFGESLSDAIMDHIANLAASNGGHLGFSDFLGVGGASLAYGAIGYLVPGIAGTMLNGSPSLSMSNMGSAGKGIAAAPVSASLSGAAAGTRALGLGAGAAGWLATKFGGGAGSIQGIPGRGGGAGSIIGSGGGGSGPANTVGQQPWKLQAAATTAKTGASPAAPGFQPAATPRSMDPDRRMYESMTGADKQPPKAQRIARRLTDLSRELQYASYRHSAGLGHDGQTGSAPTIRLTI